jgi:hypothetical protein
VVYVDEGKLNGQNIHDHQFKITEGQKLPETRFSSRIQAQVELK